MKTLLLNTIDRTMTIIFNTLKTSPLNLAMCGCLNHNQQLVTNPLIDEFTGKLYTSALEMTENIGIHYMALVVQAGVSHFDLQRLQNNHDHQRALQRAASTARQAAKSSKKTEVNEKGAAILKEPMDKDKYASTLEYLTVKNEIPDVTTIHKFLESQFNELEECEFFFLQSVILDLWLFQPWTAPLSYEEEREIGRLNQRHEEDIIVQRAQTGGSYSRSDPLSGLEIQKVDDDRNTLVEQVQAPSNSNNKPNGKRKLSISSNTPNGNGALSSEATPTSSVSTDMHKGKNSSGTIEVYASTSSKSATTSGTEKPKSTKGNTKTPSVSKESKGSEVSERNSSNSFRKVKESKDNSATEESGN